MARTWVTSDLHFSHNGVCKFLREDGTKLRPWDDAVTMDEALIENFNSRVAPGDKTYFLGDMAINRRGLPQIARLNGDKILIKGNHDIFRLTEYTEYFRDIRSYHIPNKQNIIFSHIPIAWHDKQRFRANVHGHTHGNFVRDTDGNLDPWYINVCIEQTNFFPVDIEEIYEMVNKNGSGTW